MLSFEFNNIGEQKLSHCQDWRNMCNRYYAHHFLFTYVVGKRNHMASLRESDVSSEKWPKFTSFHLILQQYWNWKNVVNAIKRKLTPFNSF